MIETKVLNPSKETFEYAKQLLLNEDVVAFPTETVYGLGGYALSDNAIKKIYEVKGRPQDNPLIVHIHPEYDIDKLVYTDFDYIYKLRKTFLPGPLTMVYRSKGVVSPIISCGLDTLAIRVPQKPVCQDFLRYTNIPIAAPSANISKHTSPVTSKHVYDDFNGLISLIIEGGKCEGGIESTVLDVTTNTPIILRSGLITYEMIKDCVGKCEYSNNKPTDKVRAPGMKYRHYMPKCETALFERDEYLKAQELYNSYIKDGRKPYFMCDEEMASLVKGNILSLGKTGEDIASNLYYMLHKGEEVADILIAFRVHTGTDLDVGINNRQDKACKKID